MVGLLDRWSKKKQKEQLQKKVRQDVPAEKSVVKDAPASAKGGKDKSVKTHSIAYKVLVHPLVTEKSAVAESLNKYCFIVSGSATKIQVKKAVEEIYGVKPLAVNMANVQGRRVRFGKNMGRRSDFKKATVTLPKGKSISIHEGV